MSISVFTVLFYGLPLVLMAIGGWFIWITVKKFREDNQMLVDQNKTILEMIEELKVQKTSSDNQKNSDVAPDESSNFTNGFQFNNTEDDVEQNVLDSEDSEFPMSSSSSDYSDDDLHDDYQKSLEMERKSMSSGYDSTSDRGKDIDWDYELYKISVAPIGPVPESQVILTVTCPINKQYVKAITDHETIVEICTFAPQSNGLWEWQRAECKECLEKVEAALKDTGCEIPFAEEGDINWELARKLEQEDREMMEKEVQEKESEVEAPVKNVSGSGSEVEVGTEARESMEAVQMTSETQEILETVRDGAEQLDDAIKTEGNIEFEFAEDDMEYDYYDLTVYKSFDDSF